MRVSSYWRWLLPALWSLAFAMLVIGVTDTFGFGGRPWFGYWDSVTIGSGHPYVARFVQVVPGGAAFRAGIRDGDRVDIRKLDAYRRFGLLFQPVTQPMVLPFLHHGVTSEARVVPTTQYDVSGGPKTANIALNLVARLWLLGCALLLCLRRWDTREGRYLSLTLMAAATGFAVYIVTPSGLADVLLFVATRLCAIAAALLPVALAARFGTRSIWRAAIELSAIVILAVYVGGIATIAVGLMTGRVDPIPLLFGASRFYAVGAFAVAAIAVSTAFVTLNRAERARAAWLLLPMPLALTLASVAQQMSTAAPTYLSYVALWILASGAMLAGAGAVTYALLARRVVDLQFFIGRTLVVACISGIVIVAFILLEWFLATVVSNVSHATGLAANAALALALGLSMSFIHTRVDRFVDLAFFRTRYENERAMRDFAKEAAFITSRDDLLDRTIETVRRHTDASAAAILLDGDGVFYVARWFGGDPPPAAGENDPLILALKARHEPVDPHRYATPLRGDLAVPMLARGRLSGVLVLGTRAGGEAYTPDETDAARELTPGAGSALDVLDRTDGEPTRDALLLEELRLLRVATEQNAQNTAAFIAMLKERTDRHYS